MNTYGYAGKILVVDLSKGSSHELSTSDYSEQFIGGRGFRKRTSEVDVMAIYHT